MAEEGKREEGKTGKEQEAWEKKNLVKLKKGDETISVHPTTVDDHLALGWVEA